MSYDDDLYAPYADDGLSDLRRPSVGDFDEGGDDGED